MSTPSSSEQEFSSLLNHDHVSTYSNKRESSLYFRNGLIYFVIGLICTGINFFIFETVINLDQLSHGVRTYEQMIKLRRPNQFLGLEKVKATHRLRQVKRIHPNLLSIVNKTAPNQAYGDDFEHFATCPKYYPPDDRKFTVSSELSTIADFMTTDYRMEDCELQLLLPPDMESKNTSLVLGDSENIVDMWLLEAPNPLYAKTLTWNNRPPRRRKVDRIVLKRGLHYSYNFTCPLNSQWTFEFSAANEETYVEWVQTWSGPSPRLTLFQHGSEGVTVDKARPVNGREDFNRAADSLKWSLPEPEQVLMRLIHASENYALQSKAWSHQLPSGGHLIHLENEDGSGNGTYTVALFHQLKCLQHLHDAYVDEGSHQTSPYAAHCLNYLRQTILCMTDMRNGPQGTKHTLAGYDMLCYDWEPIFRESERNYDTFTGR